MVSIFDYFLSVRYGLPYRPKLNQRILQSFALQRSGQHLVINWICRGLVEAIHLNNCRFRRQNATFYLKPKNRRRVLYSAEKVVDSRIDGNKKFIRSLPSKPLSNLFYSIEDFSITDKRIQKLNNRFKPTTIIILRDPANWLASSLEHKLHPKRFILQKIALFIEYLEQAIHAKEYFRNPCIVVDYNAFVTDQNYRQKLARAININNFDNAEAALSEISPFGGGSSFKKKHRSKNTLDRWKDYQDDMFYQKAINNQRLLYLAHQFWHRLPGLEEMELQRQVSHPGRCN